MTYYTRIVGTGSFLPNQIIKNDDFPSSLQTSDEWIRTRTGIIRRHIASVDASACDFATKAALEALNAAKIDALDIDLIILGTSTPEQILPSTASMVQEQLGNTKAAAFDVQAACSGFIYGLSIADQFVRTGQHKRVLVIGVDIMSRLVDWSDRSTCVLFGDGAGAVVLEASRMPGVLGSVLKSDGQYRHHLEVPGHINRGHIAGTPFLKMDGGVVFKFAVNALADASEELLQKLDIDAETIDWVVPHQANIRIIEAIASRLKLPMDKVAVTVQDHGNTSAASIPLALDRYVKSNKIQPGQRLLLVAIGSGFVWGSVLLDY